VVREQVIYKRRTDHIRTLARQLVTTDFPIRMRNQMAADMRSDEHVIDDDIVGVGRGENLGKRAAGSSLPQLGIVIATNQRLRFAAADDEQVTEVALSGLRITHDEDRAMTLSWIDPRGQQRAVTLIFMSHRAPVARHLRRATLEGGKTPTKGPATPKLSVTDRLRSKF
jgi:hypothetical protein